MEDTTKQPSLNTGLIVPKEEIIENVEITYEDDCEDSKEFIVPKEELSNSSLHLEDEYDQTVMPIKTELTLSKEISQIRSQQEMLEQGESSGYVEIKSSRRRHVHLHVETERVIEEVRRRPALWDLSDALYKDRDARARLWVEVFEELFPGYADEEEHRQKDIEKMVQQRWKTARDAYIRCRNIIKNNSSSESGRKKVYVYFDDMRFLDKKHLAQDDSCDNHQAIPTASNIDAPSKSNHEVQGTSNRYTQTANRGSTSNCDTSTPKRDTSTSKRDTSTPKRDTSTPKRDTSTSKRDTSTPKRDTSTSKRDKTTQNLDTSNRDSSMSNHRASTSKRDTLAMYDTPGPSIDTQTSNDTQNISNQDSLPPKSTLNDDTASQRVFTENHPNKRLKKGQRKRKQAGTDFEKEMLTMFREHTKLFQNDDLTFFMSLLPITKAFTNHQKLVFRSEILKKAMEIENMHNPYETKPDSSHS
ncbi:uncharacterized protein LOC123879495 isoform X2 [Maniola jurtina]|uniref:uncharacterized protein LOC123879495 isoform X2 n=1 Tax=Maniola jurtina TaxID=191418 RepID=UPI001E687C7F|nr:uncharacterized protein LOC123879495 isoform X2 [Maniola jurtina]